MEAALAVSQSPESPSHSQVGKGRRLIPHSKRSPLGSDPRYGHGYGRGQGSSLPYRHSGLAGDRVGEGEDPYDPVNIDYEGKQ